MNCSACGRQLPAGVIYCPNCGTPTPAYYAPAGTTPDTPTVESSAADAPPPPPYTNYGSQPYGGPSPYSTPPPAPYNTPPPPSYVTSSEAQLNPPPPSQRRGNRTGLILGVVVLVLLVVVGGVLAVSRLGSQGGTSTATPTVVPAQATATAQALATVTATNNLTATAQAQASATASVIAANPYPSYLPGSGTLALYDPLHDHSYSFGWDESNSCRFTGDAYHVTNPDPQYLYSCAANSTNFSNFAYEVKMKIIKGDEGGIIFRANATSYKFYLFDISSTGYYGIFLYSNSNNGPSTLVTNTLTTAINQGLNQTNVIAVVAQGSKLTIYVNQQQLVSINDSTYNAGSIGVGANSFGNAKDPTEVVFSNARVWTF